MMAEPSSVNQFLLFFLVDFIGILFAFTSMIFLALCVYNDAKFRRDKNAVLWAVLSGFNFIAAIVYLVIRNSSKNKPRRCDFCGAFMAPDGSYCSYCGRVSYVAAPEEIEKYNRKRKLFLCLWMAFFTIMVILYCIFFSYFFSLISNFNNLR